MRLEAGQPIAHYRLVEKIGEGGMGVVWKAFDTTLDREVAIKFLPAALGGDPERLARFDREAMLLASHEAAQELLSLLQRPFLQDLGQLGQAAGGFPTSSCANGAAWRRSWATPRHGSRRPRLLASLGRACTITSHPHSRFGDLRPDGLRSRTPIAGAWVSSWAWSKPGNEGERSASGNC